MKNTRKFSRRSRMQKPDAPEWWGYFWIFLCLMSFGLVVIQSYKWSHPENPARAAMDREMAIEIKK